MKVKLASSENSAIYNANKKWHPTHVLNLCHLFLFQIEECFLNNEHDPDANSLNPKVTVR